MTGRADQSKVKLANRALSLIEVDGIEAIDEQSNAAVEVRLWFDAIRDALLRSGDWNFAKRRVILPALSAGPAWGDGVYVELPADCLRVIEVNGVTDDWEVEGRRLLVAGAPAEIRYIEAAEDPQQWDPMFAMTFVHDLAEACGPKLAQLKSWLERINRSRERLLAGAKSTDGRESAGRTIADPPWVEVYDR